MTSLFDSDSRSTTMLLRPGACTARVQAGEPAGILAGLRRTLEGNPRAHAVPFNLVQMLARDSGSTLAHGRIVASDFRPHPLLGNAHLHTIASTLLRPLPSLEFQRERWELLDGDFIDLGFCGTGSGPRVVLLHGLTGGFDSKYLRGLARKLIRIGWRCVMMQFRGAGPAPNRLPRTYHHGDTADLRVLLTRLYETEPENPLFAVGWSLGANVLLKYLGESGDDTPLAGAAAVSPPFQLEPCADKLRTGFARIYQHPLLSELKSGLRRKFATMPSPIDLSRVLRTTDFFEFDSAATAPLNGFTDARDYYNKSSCGNYLSRIQRPTLILHALDDPFMRPEIVPPASALAGPVTLELSPHGGHVGFIAADRALRPYCWLERRIPEFLQSLAP